jgi:hypothetical protein
VKDYVHVARRPSDRVGIAQIAGDDFDVRSGPFTGATQVFTSARREVIEDADLCARLRECQRDVRADKACASCYQISLTTHAVCSSQSVGGLCAATRASSRASSRYHDASAE